MVTLSGKIVCDCKGNFAGKYCNIGKYNNLLVSREFGVGFALCCILPLQTFLVVTEESYRTSDYCSPPV